MKKSTLYLPLMLLASLFMAATVQAAPVDITMVANSNGELEVKLRPQAYFDGLVSSLVFTIRWNATTEAHLGIIQQPTDAATYLPITRSGGEQDEGGNRYQTFVSVSMTPMRWLPTEWVAGQEYTVMTIPVEGSAEFQLVNDTWTGLNNSDYYLALGGYDETGVIYGDLTTGIVTGSLGDGGISVMPNPTDKATTITLFINKAQDLELELVNAAGQAIWKDSRPNATGTLTIPLDLSSYDSGVYMLRVRSAEKAITKRVVKR